MIFQVCGYKNSGKTTVVRRLITALKKEGFRVGTIKHDSHDFVIDHPGTDTWHHAEAGADVVSITSHAKTAWVENRPYAFEELVQDMKKRADIVLIEGFKHGPYPKIVTLKNKKEMILVEQLKNVKAIYTRFPLHLEEVPVFFENGLDELARFVAGKLVCSLTRKKR